MKKNSSGPRAPLQYFKLDSNKLGTQAPIKKKTKFQRFVETQKTDYHHDQLQKAMKRINQYNYSWDSAPEDPNGS